ncbi:MAG: hypothetical protein JWO03_2919 [Bacteroidetes bacterium]|nr:hypothetical protein [Bacteroidota bacterium]
MVLRDPGHEKQLLIYVGIIIALLIVGSMYAYMGVR